MNWNEEIMNMIYCLHMNSKDKRRSESMRSFFYEIEQCLTMCNKERIAYKNELTELKEHILAIQNIIKED